ncbi:cation channel sperm-associated targeting subunit tau [Carettochelys insculpta]|uniref:cation channel sperm-associated targeting subunit tau n=1 Tax=Carettochelys insculpta TaxID=44489 RepID=UPI003EC1045E
MLGSGARGSEVPPAQVPSVRLGSLDSVLESFSREAVKFGRARSLLKFLQKILKTSEKGIEPPADVRNLVPCGDVSPGLHSLLGQGVPQLTVRCVKKNFLLLVLNLLPINFIWCPLALVLWEKVGCLAVHVKLCKDFTSKFNVQYNTNLLLRISVNEVMKCTNPQTFRSQLKKSRKDIVIHFEEVKYFSVQVLLLYLLFDDVFLIIGIIA